LFVQLQDKNFLHLQVGCKCQKQQPGKTGGTTLSLSIQPACALASAGRPKRIGIFFLLRLLQLPQLREPLFSDGWTTQILFTSIHTNLKNETKIKIIKSERRERKKKRGTEGKWNLELEGNGLRGGLEVIVREYQSYNV
jgi:hypothetical protein